MAVHWRTAGTRFVVREKRQERRGSLRRAARRGCWGRSHTLTSSHSQHPFPRAAPPVTHGAACLICPRNSTCHRDATMLTDVIVTITAVTPGSARTRSTSSRAANGKLPRACVFGVELYSLRGARLGDGGASTAPHHRRTRPRAITRCRDRRDSCAVGAAASAAECDVGVGRRRSDSARCRVLVRALPHRQRVRRGDARVEDDGALDDEGTVRR